MRHLIFMVFCFALSGCAEDEPVRVATDGDDLVVTDDCWEMLPSKAEMNAGIKPVLTVEESLGLVYCSRQLRSTHLARGVNPEATWQIVALLSDPQYIKIWPGAMACLAFVGGDNEALLLETYLLREYKEPDSSDARAAFNSVLFALGRMGRRGVPQARRIVEQSCKAEYWTDTRQAWDNGQPLGDHGIALELANYARLVADWRVDDALVAEFLKVDGTNFEVERERLKESLCRAAAAEAQEITQKERDNLNALYTEHFGKK